MGIWHDKKSGFGGKANSEQFCTIQSGLFESKLGM